MKQIIADTNVYLRFLLDDVKEQVEVSEKLFRKASQKRIEIVVPQIVVFEIQFALDKYYGFSRGDMVEKIETILSADFLKVEERSVFLKCLTIYKENKISFVDSFLSAKAHAGKMELFSFDKKLVKLK